MKQLLFILIISCLTIKSIGQTGVLMKRYYISGSLSIGQNERTFADSSAWLEVGADSTNKGLLFPKVILDSVTTTKRALFVYDLQDSVLYHFDGTQKVRYVTYKDTNFIKAIISQNLPDHSIYFKDGGNAYGVDATIGTTDNQSFLIKTNNEQAVKVFSNGHIVVGNETQDQGYGLDVEGGIHSDSFLALDIDNAAEARLPFLKAKGSVHPISRFFIGLEGTGSYIESPSVNFYTGNDTSKLLSLNGSAPSGGEINLDGTNRKIDFKGGMLGDGWRIYAPEGLWSYKHTSYPFQPIEFTGFTTDQGIKFNTYSAANAIQIFGSTGNVGIGNITSDGGYKLDVNGPVRLGGDVYINNSIKLEAITNSIKLLDYSLGNAFATIIIGKNNSSTPTVGNRHIIIGNSNTTSNNKLWQYLIGDNNNISGGGGNVVVLGDANTISSAETAQLIYGSNNIINYNSTSTSRGQFIVGYANSLIHKNSSVLGNYQSTTNQNQLIIADGNPNSSDGGYRDIFFGSGPVSSLETGIGAPVTIHASGARGNDKSGGFLKLAAGKSSGTASPTDIIFSTTSVTTSGSTQQSLFDRWYVKGETGYFSNSLSATSSVDISNANGYNQLRLRNSYTPTSSSDVNGNVGDVAWDTDYMYIKTSVGWKRTLLSTF